MDPNVLLSPPVAFIFILVVVSLFAAVLKPLSAGTRKKDGGLEPYACGENVKDHMIQPDYGQFFPFAFFFTILHVVTLMVATVPVLSGVTIAIAFLYVAGAALGLVLLYTR